MSTKPKPSQPPSITITRITTESLLPTTFPSLFAVAASAFGTQTHDAVFALFNPNWSTPSGVHAGAARLEARFRKAGVDKLGRPTTVFLEATVPDTDAERNPGPDAENGGGGEGRKTVGMAIWVQSSFAEGWGEPLLTETEAEWEARARKLGLEDVYPSEDDGDREMRRYIAQCERSLHADRAAVVRQIADSCAAREGQSDDDGQRTPPAAFVLDMCAVSPEAQGKGVASALVRWGLEEAQTRGGLECLTEASMMGRGVYEKLGFRKVKQVVYHVDEQWVERDRPDNVFMRTKG